MVQAARVVRVVDGFGAGEISNVCVVVWRGPVTRPRFDAQRQALAEVLGRHPERAGFLCVIEPTASPPNDDLRRESARMIMEYQPKLRCIACVVEGTGFMNAVSRSALSAMALLIGKRTMPFSVFGTIGAATTWMAPHVDSRDAAALGKAAALVRDGLEPWSPGRR